MTEAQNVMEVLYGPRLPGYCGSLELDVDFRRVRLTTPVLPPIHPDVPEIVEMARAELRSGTLPDYPQAPLPEAGHLVQECVQQQLAGYVEADRPRAARIYVLEFQGARQYCMFGRTTNLINRVVEHCRAAEPHGYGLLAGWASPGVDDAQPLEHVVLNVGDMVHGQPHYRERFYDMPFETGLNIARTVFELNSDWRTRTGVPPSPAGSVPSPRVEPIG
ncbi:hypothetical protein ACGFWE_40855 [Streptomyces sp. NPDC048523]|uniref:hypothetical protein n=1 Tax=Streptomyces sp. NPDC048523 TaxID=3365567 RepID=UPI00371598C4